MHKALQVAARAMYLSAPNPRVGCIITAADGSVLGQGHTQGAGGPHAEIMALRDAAERGHNSLQQATAWVTLEPCAHQGRTGPCCDALSAAGIGRVVAAMIDPNPQVAGLGMARLAAAGVQTQVLPPNSALAHQARELNIGFFSRMERGLPWVRMKVAASLDGQTALQNGQSQWITGPEARVDGHAWRARACAILTGIGTVLEDDPMLDVRDISTPRQPDLVVVDSALQTPLQARLWQAPAHGLSRQIWIAHANGAPTHAASALQAQGAQLMALGGTDHHKVDLPSLLTELGRREVNELHIEAGHKLNGSFLREGLVDELLVYLAPCWLGQGAGMSRFGPLEHLQDKLNLSFEQVTPVGPDLRIVARVNNSARFLTPDHSSR